MDLNLICLNETFRMDLNLLICLNDFCWMYINFIFQGFYTGIEKTKVHMKATISSCLINLYLNIGFIYGTTFISNPENNIILSKLSFFCGLICPLENFFFYKVSLLFKDWPKFSFSHFDFKCLEDFVQRFVLFMADDKRLGFRVNLLNATYNCSYICKFLCHKLTMWRRQEICRSVMKISLDIWHLIR